MQIVDGHHHLWDLEAVDYPWLRARGVRRFFGDPTPIQRNYGVRELRADAAPAAVEILQSVHVQVGCAPGMELAETLWLDSVGTRDGLPTAIIAAVDLTRGDVGDLLAAHAVSPRLRGVRQIVGREPADDARTGCARVLEDPAFLQGLRTLAAHGLSFDLQLTVPLMERVADVLTQVPELPVALCHCGSPWDQTPAGLEVWRQGLNRLARLPRLVCKISGLSMFEPRWTTERFVNLAQTVLGIFGPERCLFGSNFPVDGLHRGYGEIVAATNVALQGFGAAASESVYRDTARRFYRL